MSDGLSKCSSCGAEIFWALTDKGKRIPMDAEPVKLPGLFVLMKQGSLLRASSAGSRGDVVPALYQSHFATCPNAASHRGQGKGDVLE